MTIMPTKPRAARTVLGSVEVNGGRDRGELVREADATTEEAPHGPGLHPTSAADPDVRAG